MWPSVAAAAGPQQRTPPSPPPSCISIPRLVNSAEGRILRWMDESSGYMEEEKKRQMKSDGGVDDVISAHRGSKVKSHSALVQRTT